MIISVRFSKPCKAISGSLASCDGVLLTFAAASAKPLPAGRTVPRKRFQPFEVKR